MQVKTKFLILNNFLNALLLDFGASLNTISSYKSDLEEFLNFIKNPVLATTDDINNFILNLYKNSKKPTTIARKISSIKKFYKFLMDEKEIKENPTCFINKPRYKRNLVKT